MRLNKFIAETGVCSRREADQWIEAGRVTCNGVRAALGTQVRDGDEVRMDGELVAAKKRQIYIALNKPTGITCTSEPHIRDNIIELVGHSERIFPIGRLDKDSEGLILLTNDGDMVNEILRSENNHEKEYIVTVDRPITDLALRMMASGVKIMGHMTKTCTVTRIDGRHLSHDSHAGVESPDPPHVLRARLQNTAAAARPHHEHPPRHTRRRPMAQSDRAGSRPPDAPTSGTGRGDAVRPHAVRRLAS